MSIRTPINNGLLQSDLDCAGFDLLNFSGGGGGGLPAGGTTGQLLQKQSSTDGDADWATIASGGGMPGVFVNVREAPYNATGNGVTDDTNAINTAMSDVVAAGGGTVFFPHGIYLCNGPFHIYWKSILVIPFITANTDSPRTLQLLGENMPTWQVVAGGVQNYQYISTIKTTRTDGMAADSNGFAAIIAGGQPKGNGRVADYTTMNGLLVRIKNIHFQCPDDPTMGGIRLDGVGWASVEETVVYAGGSLPTHGTTGVWMPNTINWSISWINGVSAGNGFDTAFKIGEHCHIIWLQAWASKVGVAFLESMYPIRATIQIGNCIDAIKFVGQATVDARLETEHGGAPWTAAHDISDPSNYGSGRIICYVGAGFPPASSLPSVDGGAGLQITDWFSGTTTIPTVGRLTGRILATNLLIGYTDTGLSRSNTSEVTVTNGSTGLGNLVASTIYLGTDARLVPISGGAKLQARNTGTGLWADVDQWTNP